MVNTSLRFVSTMFFFFSLFGADSGQAQSMYYLSTGKLSAGKSSSFAGGSACCGCKIDHYGNLPSDLPNGKLKSVTFYLRDSRADSYYNRIKKGPNQLKLILGDNESIATSQQLAADIKLPIKASWLITFHYSPPIDVKANMDWKLLDGDNNKYSAVLLHSGDLDLDKGLRGFYKTYNCQYSRVEEQSYSVKFDFMDGDIPKDNLLKQKLTVKGTSRQDVLTTAVVEFEERGALDIKDAGAIIAEWMTTALNKTGAFEVYERLSLTKLAEEHKLGMSGLLDAESIAEIGKMRGVQAIVTGSIIKFEDIISVTAKLIDTETAKIIDSADIKVNSFSALSQQIDRIALELAYE